MELGFSIVILNYNGKEYLYNCLSSVLRSNYENFEVIFVDNASTDDSLEYVKRIFGGENKIKIIVNKTNAYCSEGNNIGLKYSTKELVTLLNPDTIVDSNWLQEINKVFENNEEVGAAQSMLLYMDNPRKIQTGGHFILDFCGLTWDSYLGMNYDEVCSKLSTAPMIGAAMGAAFTIRRSLINQLGLFDPKFSLYFEDTDLSWRIWLSGHNVVLISQSKVYHFGGASFKESDWKKKTFWSFLQHKNCIRMLIKNYSSRNLCKWLPTVIASLFAMSIYHLRKGNPARIIGLTKGILWNIENLRDTLMERKKVQRFMRKVDDEYIADNIMKRLPFLELVKRFTDSF